MVDTAARTLIKDGTPYRSSQALASTTKAVPASCHGASRWPSATGRYPADMSAWRSRSVRPPSGPMTAETEV